MPLETDNPVQPVIPADQKAAMAARIAQQQGKSVSAGTINPSMPNRGKQIAREVKDSWVDDPGVTGDAGGWVDDPYSVVTVPEQVTAKTPGGFIASAKQTAGQLIKGAGQAAADYIPGVGKDNALKQYGQEVIEANPTAVHSLSDIADQPWMATKEAAGNAAPSVAEMVAIRAAGQGITALSPLAGPFAPAVALAGQAVSWLGPMAVAALPSYGGIRDKQIINDPANEESAKAMAIAAMGAGAVGAIEVAFGPQQWALAAMTKEGRAALAEKFAATTLAGSVGKASAIGALQEGSEELVQNPIEQASAGDNPLTRENLKDTAFGGAMGALGGGVLGGGAGLVGNRTQKQTPPPSAPPPFPTYEEWAREVDKDYQGDALRAPSKLSSYEQARDFYNMRSDVQDGRPPDPPAGGGTPRAPLSPIEQARADAEILKTGKLIPEADESRVKKATLIALYGENNAVRQAIEGDHPALIDRMLKVAPKVSQIRDARAQADSEQARAESVLAKIESAKSIPEEKQTPMQAALAKAKALKTKVKPVEEPTFTKLLDKTFPENKGQKIAAEKAQAKIKAVSKVAVQPEKVKVELHDATPALADNIPDDSQVFIIDQIEPATGKFDTHKVVTGARGFQEAKELYDGQFADKSGQSRRGAVSKMSPEDFKTWLKGDTTKPVKYVQRETKPEVKSEDDVVAAEGWILRRPDSGRVIKDAITGNPKTYDSEEAAQHAADKIARDDKPKTHSNNMPAAPKPEAKPVIRSGRRQAERTPFSEDRRDIAGREASTAAMRKIIEDADKAPDLPVFKAEPTKEATIQPPKGEPSATETPKAVKTETPEQKKPATAAINDNIRVLIARKAKVGQQIGGKGLVSYIDKAIKLAKSGGKASDFKRIAKIFKGSDAETHTALMSIANTLEPKTGEKKAKPSTDLIGRIKQLGGINSLYIGNKGDSTFNIKSAFSKNSEYMLSMANHLRKLGGNPDGLTDQQIEDAVYEAEDALVMARMDADNLDEDEAEVLTDLVSDGEDIPFEITDAANTDAIDTYFGYGANNEKTDSGKTESPAAGKQEKGAEDLQRRAAEPVISEKEIPKTLIIEIQTEAGPTNVNAFKAMVAANQEVSRLQKLRACI